jgi:subtilisin family serine protease
MRIAALVLLLVAVVTADVAPLLHVNNADVIPGSYIVVLKEGLRLTDRDAHILSLKDTIAERALDAEIVHVYNIGSFIGFSARLTEDLLKAELAHPYVKYIEADQVMSINYQQEKETRAPLDVITQTGATWGIDRISKVSLPLTGQYTYNVTGGQGVDVYVIDTGILTTHTDFGGRATAPFNAVTNEANTDLNGHGTHCAGTIGGTIYGVAKNVNLLAVKVLSASGGGTTAGVISGVNYVTNYKSPTRPSVGSMSLGGGASQTLDDAVTASILAGTVYSIAAGNNNGPACNYSPARVAGAVTVGATDNTDARASYSNYGTCVNIFAPGTSVTSDWIGSNTATNTISGTSMATPHVAGVLALHLGTFPASPVDIFSWLNSTATSGKVTNPGAGSPNQFLYSPSS